MSTLAKPHIPRGSEPSRDDDQTGVRALLSALPEPNPMPEHLVHRINASLAAEQAQRGARMSAASMTPMTPITPMLSMLSTARRRRSRLLFGIAGAAAVALVAVVGSNALNTRQNTTSASPAAAASTSGADATKGAAPPSDAQSQPRAAAGRAATPSQVQVSLSGTSYTQADFETQARAFHRSHVEQLAAESSGSGFISTPAGINECLAAIGAAGAEAVQADVASYQGRPAVVIVAITKGTPVAYAVGPGCSRANPAVLHRATPLS